VDDQTCAEISASPIKSKRALLVETIVIDGVQRVPCDMQARLARALEDGLLAGGPRVIALLDDENADADDQPLNSLLWYALSALTVRMPSLAERPGDRLPIAYALLPTLAARMGRPVPELDPDAAELIGQEEWPGNVRQMRAVLSAAIAVHRQPGPIGGAEIARQLRRRPVASRRPIVEGIPGPLPLDKVLSSTNFSMPELEREMYAAAVRRADGNVSAAARLLGISRAQLAYRLAAHSGRQKAAAGEP
jgi:DNA-binding NtrC family response regulator